MLRHSAPATSELKTLINMKFRISEVMELVRLGADPNIKDKHGNSLLHLFVEKLLKTDDADQRNEIWSSIEELVTKHHADINATNDNGLTPLECLLYENFYFCDAVQLVRLGADPNTKDMNGNSLLHIFICDIQKSNEKEMLGFIKELVTRYKANINTPNNDGFTPLEYYINYYINKDKLFVHVAMYLVRLGAQGDALLLYLMRDYKDNKFNDEMEELVEKHKPDLAKILNINPSYKLNSARLKIEKKVGSGSRGEIFLSNFNNRQVVIKQIQFKGIGGYRTDLNRYCNEVKYLCKFTEMNLENVVKFVGYDIQTYPCSYNIIMEYVPQGSLEFIIDKEPNSLKDWGRRFNIAKGMTIGLEGIHQYIIHGDIRSANILIDSEWQAKITDFDLMKEKNKPVGLVSGARFFIAPELFYDGLVSEQSDVYSLAITLIHLWALKHPDDIFPVNKRNDIYKHLVAGKRLDIPKDCPEKLAAMVTWGWKTKPEERPLAKDLREEFETDINTMSERLLKNR